MSTKEECQFKMNYARNAFYFSVGSFGLATKPPSNELLKNFKFVIQENNIHVLEADETAPKTWLQYEFSFSEPLQNNSAEIFVKQTFNHMILQTFEAAWSYAKSNDLNSEYRNQEFFFFCLHLRNAISHNGKWSFKNKSYELPTTFRNKEINRSLEGKDIEGFINWVFGLQLCATISLWVSQSTPCKS